MAIGPLPAGGVPLGPVGRGWAVVCRWDTERLSVVLGRAGLPVGDARSQALNCGKDAVDFRHDVRDGLS